MVLKIFFYGMIAGFIAIFLEKGFFYLNSLFKKSDLFNVILGIFVGGALIEEYLKYAAIKFGVFKSSELDEPFDLILYMIISALGFAALENVLVLTNFHPSLTVFKSIETMTWRFVSATFLHTLSSAFVGCFLVLAFRKIKKRNIFIFLGIFFATALHGLYNLSIMNIDGLEKFIAPFIIILGLTLFISSSFNKIKKSKGVCSMNN